MRSLQLALMRFVHAPTYLLKEINIDVS